MPEFGENQPIVEANAATDPVVGRVVARARRRMVAADLARRIAPCLIGSTLLAAMVLAIDRLGRWNAPPVLLLAIALGGLPVAIGWALWRRPAAFDAAKRLDHALALKDRMGTLLALSDDRREARSPFAEVVRADAAATASRIDLRRTIPVVWPAGRYVAAVLMLAVAGVAWRFAPERTRLVEQRLATVYEAQRAKREAAAQAIRDANRELEELRPSIAAEAQAGEGGDAATAETMAALARLASLMDQSVKPSGEEDDAAAGALPRDGDLDADTSLAEAADELDRLAQRLEIEADAALNAADATSRMLDDLPAAKTDGPLSDFVDALRTADYDRAAESLARFERDLNALPAEDRAAAIDRLRRAAAQLEELRQAEEARNAAERDRLDEALAEHGLSDSTDSEAQSPPASTQPDDAAAVPTPASMEERLREVAERQGMDPQQAAEWAERLAERQRRQEAQEQATRNLDEAARDLQRLADTMEEQSAGAGAAPEEREPPAAVTQPSSSGADRLEEPRDAGEPTTRPLNAPREGDRDESRGAEPSSEPTRGTGDRPDSDASQSVEGAGRPDSAETRPDASSPAADESASEPSPTTAPSATGETRAPSPSEDHPSPRGEALPQAGTTQPQDGVAAGEENRAPRDAAPRQRTHVEDRNSSQQIGAEPAPGDVQPDSAEPSDGGEEPPEPQSPSEAARALRERLERWSAARDRARGQREISDEMRQKARELLERMSPEDREELQRWAREFADENASSGGDEPAAETAQGESGDEPLASERDLASDRKDASGSDHRGTTRHGSPTGDGEARGAPSSGPQAPSQYATESVDARRQPDDDIDSAQGEVLAEWLSEDPNAPDRIDRSEGTSVRLRRAAEAMERAVTDESIPLRYRNLIRNWARRLPERVEASDASDAPSGDASDGG